MVSRLLLGAISFVCFKSGIPVILGDTNYVVIV
jgi:hypothetical protein